jgi:peptidyl-prolyl cis-trans isomerase C
MISRKSLFLAVGAAISILLPACKPPAPAESKPEAAPAAPPAPATEAAAPAAESEAVSAVTEPVSLETAGTTPEAPQAESTPATFKPIELPEVVAKVNGQDIPRSELQEFFNATLQAAGAKVEDLTPQQQVDGYNELLQNLITDKLVSDAASGEKVSDADVDAEIAKIKKQFPDEKTFDEQLTLAGQTQDKLRKNISKMLAQQRWMQSQAKAPDITEADAKKFYESNPKEFQQPETVKASHILFMVDEGASEEVVNSKKAAAEKAAGRAAKGEDFTALAKELSEEPGAAETGGDLGFFPKDRMVPEFADAAFSQKVGEVGQPVKTQFGWHVIKVTDKRDAGEVPFAEVKDQIAAYLKNTGRREAEQNVIKKLRESAKVETFIPSAS